MKKGLFFCIVLSAALASCTTVTKTATTVDVNNTLPSNSEVDLEISQNKVNYVYRTTSKERRGGRKNIINSAVQAVLKANGNADVLVAPQYELVKKKGLFGSKIKTVTVTGYPAKYKNFRNK